MEKFTPLPAYVANPAFGMNVFFYPPIAARLGVRFSF